MNDMSKKMAFITQHKAEPWKLVIQTADNAEILKARTVLPPQTVPDDALALTMGVDVQKYGFWFVVRAWARDYTSWLIHYGELVSWMDVEEMFFNRTYPSVSNPNRRLPIWRMGLDTGGSDTDYGMSMTEAAYWWLVANVPKARANNQAIYGTKGSSRPIPGMFKAGEELLKAPSGKRLPQWLRLMLIDTQTMKDLYHYHLNRAVNADPQGAYLHSETGEDYVRQILAEEKRKDRKGVEEWVRVKKDNHYFDAEVLCMSLAHYQWPAGGVNILRGNPIAARTQQPEDRQEPQRAVEAVRNYQRPNWLGGR